MFTKTSNDNLLTLRLVEERDLEDVMPKRRCNGPMQTVYVQTS